MSDVQIFTIHCHFSNSAITISIKTCSYLLIWPLKWQIQKSPTYQMFIVLLSINIYGLICVFSFYTHKILLTILRSWNLHVFKPLCCAEKPDVDVSGLHFQTLVVQREDMHWDETRAVENKHKVTSVGLSRKIWPSTTSTNRPLMEKPSSSRHITICSQRSGRVNRFELSHRASLSK